jgi:hypothetical protein
MVFPLNLEKGGVCRLHLVGDRVELEPVAQPVGDCGR